MAWNAAHAVALLCTALILTSSKACSSLGNYVSLGSTTNPVAISLNATHAVLWAVDGVSCPISPPVFTMFVTYTVDAASRNLIFGSPYLCGYPGCIQVPPANVFHLSSDCKSLSGNGAVYQQRDPWYSMTSYRQPSILLFLVALAWALKSPGALFAVVALGAVADAKISTRCCDLIDPVHWGGSLEMWFTIEDLSYVALSEYETYKASLQNCSRTITGLMGYGYQAPLEDQYFHGEEIGATYTAIYGEDGRSVRIDFGDFVPLQRCNGNYTLSSCIGVHASDYCESQGYGELPSGTLWKFVSKPRNSCALLQAEWGAVYGWQNGRAAALAISFSLMLALTIFSTSL